MAHAAPGFPAYKTVQRRLKVWLQPDAFRQAWQQVAQRYEALHGINGDEILLDGSNSTLALIAVFT